MPRTNLTTAFKHHAPKGNQAKRYQILRKQGEQLASAIVKLTPAGDEQDQAVMLVRQAVMMANAAIACGEAGATATGERAFNEDEFEFGYIGAINTDD
jgi:hypothetical protein